MKKKISQTYFMTISEFAKLVEIDAKRLMDIRLVPNEKQEVVGLSYEVKEEGDKSDGGDSRPKPNN